MVTSDSPEPPISLELQLLAERVIDEGYFDIIFLCSEDSYDRIDFFGAVTSLMEADDSLKNYKLPPIKERAELAPYLHCLGYLHRDARGCFSLPE